MSDPQSKTTWEAYNMIQVTIKINRQQAPELYRLLSTASSKSGTIRELLRKAVAK